VTLNADVTCTGTFTLDQHTLTLVPDGNGSGTLNGAGNYDPGTVVAISAVADPGSTFGGWSGDADCPDGSVTLNSDVTCTGTFNETGADSPGAAVDAVIADLEALLVAAGKSKTLDKAIKELNKSRDPKLWQDDTRLDPKHGKKVFDSQDKAVKELRKLLKKPKGIDVAAIQAAIDAILDANRNLAETAIGAVPDSDNNKVAKEMGKANDALAKGDTERAKGKPEKAIDKYKKAWEHAVKAAKEAAK
jgi:hypothetical protein